MAENPIKYSDLFQDDGGVDKLIQKINEVAKAYATAQDLIQKEMKETQASTKKVDVVDPESIKRIAELEKKLEQLTKRLKENKAAKSEIQKLQEKAIQLQTNEAKIAADLRIKIQQQTQALKNEVIVEKEQQGSLKQLEAQLRQNIERYKSLSREERENVKVGGELLKTIQRQDAQVKQLNTTIGRSQVFVGEYQRAFQGLGAAIGKGLGFFGLAAGATGLINVIRSSIGIFSSFEKANSNLTAVLGITKEEASSLVAEAKLLGATTSFTASQVTELQTEFGKLGFPIEDIHAMTASTLAAAAAMGSQLGETAALTGSALQAFGLDASEATRVNDVLSKATILTALDFKDLAANLATVSPVANAFGFTIEETTALLGELSNAGFDASSGATATRNILLNLADSNGKLAKSLKEPVKDIPSLVKGLKQLKSEGIDLAAALELTDVRSVGAFNTFLEGSDSINTLTEALNNAKGTAQEMADKQLDNLSGAVTILGSAWEGFILGLEKGDGLLGKFLRGVVETTSSLLGFFTNTEKVSDALEKERISLFAVQGELNSVNTTSERRNELILQLQKQYPDYLKNINAETVSNEELNKALMQINESLVNRIRLQIKQEEIEAQARRVAELQNELAERRLRLFDAEGKAAEKAGKLREEAQKIIERGDLKDAEKGRLLLDLLDNRTKAQQALSGATSVYATAQRTQGNSTEKLADALSAFQEVEANLAAEQAKLNDLTANHIDLNNELNKSNKDLKQTTAEITKEEKERLGLIEEIDAKIKALNEEQQKSRERQRILAINKELEVQKKLREDLLGITEAERLKKEEEERKKRAEEEQKLIDERLKANEALIKEIEKIENDGVIRRIESEEEKEIELFNFKLNARKSEIEDSIADEELKQRALKELEIEGEEGRAEIRNKFRDEEKKKNDELEKEKREAAKQTQDLIINKAFETLENIEKRQQELLDKEIEAQERQRTTQQERAAQGLENTLAFEEAELAKLEQKKLESERRAIRLEKVKALYSAYSAAASAGDNNAIVKVLRDFALIQGIENSLSSFGEGTGEHGTVAEALSSKRSGSKGGNSIYGGLVRGESHKRRGFGVPILVEGGEGILSVNQMKALGVDNFQQLAKNLDSGIVGTNIFSNQIGQVPVLNTVNIDLSSLKHELRSVKQAIENQPRQQVNVEQLSKSYTDFVDTRIEGNRKVISRFRVNKKRI